MALLCKCVPEMAVPWLSHLYDVQLYNVCMSVAVSTSIGPCPLCNVAKFCVCIAAATYTIQCKHVAVAVSTCCEFLGSFGS